MPFNRPDRHTHAHTHIQVTTEAQIAVMWLRPSGHQS